MRVIPNCRRRFELLESLNRFAELYSSQGVRTAICEERLWVEYNRMVIPVGPVKWTHAVSKERARALLAEFPSCLMLRYTKGHEIECPCDAWYAVICEGFTDPDELSRNTRSKITRGLKHCSVERVDASLIAKRGYKVFVSAFARYKNVGKPVPAEKDFKRSVLATKGFDDIVHYWGVFKDGAMIAYSTVQVYDGIEANYSTIKFDPSFLKFYPSYAMFHTMNKYYLHDRKSEYVNDGFRNILHQTNIQTFLIDKFKFKKLYTRAVVHYRPYLSFLVSCTYFMRNTLKKLDSKLKALYTIEEIRRVCCKA